MNSIRKINILNTHFDISLNYPSVTAWNLHIKAILEDIDKFKSRFNLIDTLMKERCRIEKLILSTENISKDITIEQFGCLINETNSVKIDKKYKEFQYYHKFNYKNLPKDYMSFNLRFGYLVPTHLKNDIEYVYEKLCEFKSYIYTKTNFTSCDEESNFNSKTEDSKYNESHSYSHKSKTSSGSKSKGSKSKGSKSKPKREEPIYRPSTDSNSSYSFHYNSDSDREFEYAYRESFRDRQRKSQDYKRREQSKNSESRSRSRSPYYKSEYTEQSEYVNSEFNKYSKYTFSDEDFLLVLSEIEDIKSNNLEFLLFISSVDIEYSLYTLADCKKWILLVHPDKTKLKNHKVASLLFQKIIQIQKNLRMKENGM